MAVKVTGSPGLTPNNKPEMTRDDVTGFPTGSQEFIGNIADIRQNSDMKTIAITIDEKTLKRIDRLKTDANARFRSRSEVIRQAALEFVARLERLTEEDRERDIFRRNRERLDRQSRELIKEQAKP